MPYRDSVIDYLATVKDAATYSQDMDFTDPISAIELEVRCTNGATYNKDNWLTDILTKVEIADGSDVLYSLTGTELVALQYYKTGKLPPLYFSESAGGQQRMVATLLFGRYLWDNLYALNFGRYKNPKLKLTFNKAAIRAASVTGFATGDNILLTVVAKVMDGMSAGGAGYLMAKEIDSFTQAATGDKRIELPLDLTYRLIMLRSYLAGNDIDENVSHLKLTLDTDKVILLDRKVKQLDAEVEQAMGEITWKQNIFRKHGETPTTILNKEPRIVPVPTNVRGSAIPWAYSGNYYLDLFDMAGAAITTEEDVWTLQTGHAPFSTIPLWQGMKDDPVSWFDPRPYKKVELVLTQAAAAAAAIVVEQVRP